MRTNIIKGTFASAITTFVSTVGNLLIIPMYLMYLGKEQYGLWLVVLSLVSYLGLSNLGIQQSLANLVAGHNAKKENNNIIIIASTSFWLFAMIVTAMLILVLVFVSIAPIESIIRVSEELKEVVIPVLLISSIFFLAKLPLGIFNSTLRSLNMIYEEQIFSLIFIVIQFLGVIAVLLSGISMIGLSFVYGATGLLSGTVIYIYLKKKIPNFRISIQFFDRGKVKKILSPGSYFFVLSLAGALLVGTDNIIISSQLGTEHVTAYAIAFKIFFIMISIGSLLAANLLPSISEAFAVHNKQYLKDVYIKLFKLCFGFGLISSFMLYVAGPEIMVKFVGADNYVGDSTFFLIVLLGFIFVILWPSDAILIGTSQHKWYAIMAVIEAIINVILSFWWIHIWGVFGVIMATLFTRILTNLWFMPYRVFIVTGAGLRVIVVKVIKPFILPVIFTLLIIYVFSFYDFVGWQKILILLPIVLSIFSTACYYFTLNKNEKYEVNKIISILKVKLRLIRS